MQFKSILIFLSFFLLLNCGDVKKENISQKEGVKQNKEKSLALYTNLKGENVSLENFKGKRLLVNFWATWCTPCLQEMPSLVHAQELLKDENYVLLFPTTDKLETIKIFNDKKKYPLEFLHYSGTLDQLNIYALPATLIYNAEGKMVKRIDGATEWDSAEIINLLKAIK
ncbi:MAG: TlpA family protein disulfide reductase [Flavobacteriaceae bacterium]|nr:TlpA family protein disulfide reductase [Flavobacteriaceae bacterium]